MQTSVRVKRLSPLERRLGECMKLLIEISTEEGFPGPPEEWDRERLREIYGRLLDTFFASSRNGRRGFDQDRIQYSDAVKLKTYLDTLKAAIADGKRNHFTFSGQMYVKRTGVVFKSVPEYHQGIYATGVNDQNIYEEEWLDLQKRHFIEIIKQPTKYEENMSDETKLEHHIIYDHYIATHADKDSPFAILLLGLDESEHKYKNNNILIKTFNNTYWDSFDEIIMTIFTHYYAVFKGYDRIKLCRQCSRIFYEKKEKSKEFCSSICRSSYYRSRGEEKRLCRRRQNEWLRRKGGKYTVQKNECNSCATYIPRANNAVCSLLLEKNELQHQTTRRISSVYSS